MSKTGQKRSRGYMVFVVVFMGLVNMLDNYLALIEGVAFPYVIAEYGISDAELAFWLIIYGILAFTVFFIGWISDSFGRKKGILVLLLVMGIPALLIGLGTIFILTFHLFMIFYAILTIGTISNLWEVPVTEEAPAEKRGIYGGLATLIGLIPLYAFLGPAIYGLTGSWQWMFGIMFFFMLILLIPLYFMKEPQRWLDSKEDRGHKMLKIKTALKSLSRKDLRYILLATVVYGCWGIAFKMGSTWNYWFFTEIRGYYSEALYMGTILRVAGLCILGGAITAGILLDKIGRKITLIIGCSGSVVGLIGIGITPAEIAYIFMWIGYFFMALTFAWIVVYFAEIFPNEVRSTALGLTMTTSRVSYIIAPLLVLLLMTIDPTWTIFWLIPGLLMIIPIFSLLAKPYETKGKSLEEIQEER